MLDTSPMQDNSEAAWIDSVLYSDQTADNFTPYGANGFGAAWYGVTATLDGKEIEVYDGQDFDRAKREAIAAFERYHRKAYVSLSNDGGSWKYVFCLPRERVKDAKPVVIDCGFCIDPRCGEINPLDCWCRYFMTPEEIERYKQYS
ncbi:hypothetical protein ACWDBD_38750 [Streptomyces sp. NPDC001118]|uniref:hypothetical protein n=1 Tax=Streptomyces sp. NPDC001127 TaxID=3154377 RepID=UPI003326D22E